MGVGLSVERREEPWAVPGGLEAWRELMGNS